jgi:hypothetical protein
MISETLGPQCVTTLAEDRADAAVAGARVGRVLVVGLVTRVADGHIPRLACDQVTTRQDTSRHVMGRDVTRWRGGPALGPRRSTTHKRLISGSQSSGVLGSPGLRPLTRRAFRRGRCSTLYAAPSRLMCVIRGPRHYPPLDRAGFQPWLTRLEAADEESVGLVLEVALLVVPRAPLRQAPSS